MRKIYVRVDSMLTGPDGMDGCANAHSGPITSVPGTAGTGGTCIDPTQTNGTLDGDGETFPLSNTIKEEIYFKHRFVNTLLHSHYYRNRSSIQTYITHLITARRTYL